MPNRGKIFRILRECEASARSLLKSLNNPPEEQFAALKAKKKRPYTWNNNVPHYYRAIRLVGEVRRNIAKQNSPAAALAAFRLGQRVIVSRDQIAYEALDRVQKDLKRKSDGGKKHSLSPETVQKIQEHCDFVCRGRPQLRNHPYTLAQMVARKFGCDRKTVLKYINKDRMK